MYDVHLGGSHNFAVDREFAEQVTRVMPELPDVLRANRSFLRRAVRYLVDAGIRQFLDLGSGIPTVGNVHEIAQGADPTCRVVYVDVDPIAVAHSRRILGPNPLATVVQHDLRDPEAILTDPQVTGLLDFTQPVAVLMVAVLHFVPGTDDPAGIVAGYADAVVPGSYVVISHASAGEMAPERSTAAAESYRRDVTEFSLRTREEVTGLFGALEIVDPGVVYVAEWHPDEPVGDSKADRLPALGGVGRKADPAEAG